MRRSRKTARHGVMHRAVKSKRKSPDRSAGCKHSSGTKRQENDAGDARGTCRNQHQEPAEGGSRPAQYPRHHLGPASTGPAVLLEKAHAQGVSLGGSASISIVGRRPSHPPARRDGGKDGLPCGPCAGIPVTRPALHQQGNESISPTPAAINSCRPSTPGASNDLDHLPSRHQGGKFNQHSAFHASSSTPHAPPSSCLVQSKRD